MDLEVFGPNLKSTPIEMEKVFDEEGNVLDVCNKPMQIVKVLWKGPIEKDAMVRRIRQDNV
jgi:putative protease